MSSFVLGGPRLRIGLETKLKFLQLRFGFVKSIDFYLISMIMYLIKRYKQGDIVWDV